jgi:hypothetical protein
VSLPYKAFEAQHLTLTPGADTVVTFDPDILAIRIRNWSTTDRVLVKQDVISGAADPLASRVGIAGATDIPTVSTFPVRTSTIHILSAGAAEVTVEGYH